MTKLEDVVYETQKQTHWVLRVKNGYEVYRNGTTVATRCAIIGWAGSKGLKRAKIEADKREAAMH